MKTVKPTGACHAGDQSHTDPVRPADQRAPAGPDTAEFIALMTAELADIAAAARFDMLTYFLNMARCEAESLYLSRK